VLRDAFQLKRATDDRHARAAEIVGFVGFRPFFDPPELQLLHGLLPSHWGRGLAAEAVRTAMRCAFDRLGFEEVRAATDVPNGASVRVRRPDDGEHGTVFFRLGRPEPESPAG
jgi:RimJ/RimL family protein N-acetyltransferase